MNSVTSNTELLNLRNVSVRYEHHDTSSWSLKNIDLQVAKGEVVLFCGASGCGKSTLLRLANGLIPHYFDADVEGSIQVQGKDLEHFNLALMARQVGSVFQNPSSQFFATTVEDELAFSLENQGYPVASINQRIADITEQFSLQDQLPQSIFELSSGQQQKLACASASMLNPDVYVLDEPSANLDAEGIAMLRATIKRWSTQGKTVLIAEHRLYYLNGLVDRVVHIADGQIRDTMTGEQFFSCSSHTLKQQGLRSAHFTDLCCSPPPTSEFADSYQLSPIQLGRNGQMWLDMPSISFPKGQVTTIIGANGAGKSSLMKVLAGQYRDKGVLNDNQTQWRWRALQRHSFFVSQHVHQQLIADSVLEEIQLSMPEPSEQGAREWLHQVGLEALADKHPLAMSRGQQQRLALLTALASERELLLLDEPTSGLDWRNMTALSELILTACRSNRTVIVISHDPEFITKVSQQVLVLESGYLKSQFDVSADQGQQLLAELRSFKKISALNT
ncbi:ABC transporter ATP-binding protein [Photobacterium sanguinicancri]|uniref:ABC transporter n=1 Tax=Photobacterium sanguinicancri TaxID=875932 RepID=A0ABX4G4W3_9GAMM|nr:ABC transporter ATP-binding protein [Photobacterium sanguinicancri]OZS45961.1 ABC transporter [Photobacterium sanguinicancri]